MAPVGVPGMSRVIHGVYAPTPRVRVRANSMADTYAALGRVVETLTRAGRYNDAVESVAWDQFKSSAQALTGDMTKVRDHYRHAVDEFSRYVEQSTVLHNDVTTLVASYNGVLDQLLLLRSRHATASQAAQPSAQDVLSSMNTDPLGGMADLQERIAASAQEAATLAEEIRTAQAEATRLWDSIGEAERAQQNLADTAAAALRGARDVSGLNDGFWGNLGAFLAGLLDIVISVLKIIVMVLLVVLTLVTILLTPLIGPGPAAGLLLLTIFVAGALFVAQVLRAALAGLDFGALMAAIGAAALHFGAVVLGAFLGGIAGAFIKGLLGSLGPLIAGAVAAAVRMAVQQGVTKLVDDTLVEGLLELGGPEAREIYDEIVNSPAGQFLEAQAGGFGAGAAEASGALSAAEQVGGALGESLDPLLDAAGGLAGDFTGALGDVGAAIDDVFGDGSADLLRDAGFEFGKDVLAGGNVGDALTDGITQAGTDWLEQRVDSFLDLVDDLGGDVLDAFDQAGLGGLDGPLSAAGLGEIADYGQALAEAQDPLSLLADSAGEGIDAWFTAHGAEDLATAARGTPLMSWIGSGND